VNCTGEAMIILVDICGLEFLTSYALVEMKSDWLILQRSLSPISTNFNLVGS
jgi:hypothetical protein